MDNDINNGIAIKHLKRLIGKEIKLIQLSGNERKIFDVMIYEEYMLEEDIKFIKENLMELVEIKKENNIYFITFRFN